ADHVVLGLLRDEGDPRGLRVGTEAPGLLLLGAVDVAHPLGPDPAGGAELGDLLEEVVVDVEEEGEAGREVVYIETARDTALDVLETVPEGEGELLRRGRASLAD